MFPPHCIRGSVEAEVIPELADLAEDILPKTRYSAFYGTELEQQLRELSPDKVIVCGVCTDICVIHTTADARNRDYPVEVRADCVASFDEEAHRFALQHMEKILGAKVVASSPGEAVKDLAFPIPDAVLNGDTADIYFLRACEVMEREGVNPRATMEVFPSRDGILCGMREVLALLRRGAAPRRRGLGPGGRPALQPQGGGPAHHRPLSLLRHLRDGHPGHPGPRERLGDGRPPVRGGRRDIPMVSFGARHVHPAVAPYMDYAAMVGGCAACSTPEGARLAGVVPSGTMPHAMIICFGDTVRAAIAFDKHMPPEVPRMVLVDTFHDEPEESLAVAEALRERLQGVRLDTPGERGGVTPDLVKEARARLDLAGFPWVQIFVSGGVTPDRIREMRDEGAPVDGFGVGSYITSARPIDFTADLHESRGQADGQAGPHPRHHPQPATGPRPLDPCACKYLVSEPLTCARRIGIIPCARRASPPGYGRPAGRGSCLHRPGPAMPA